jgi:hypothetical protein
MGSLPGVKRPEREASQKLYLLHSSRMSEDILHLSVCFHGVETKYLNGRGSGCPTCRTLEPWSVFKCARIKLHEVKQNIEFENVKFLIIKR